MNHGCSGLFDDRYAIEERIAIREADGIYEEKEFTDMTIKGVFERVMSKFKNAPKEVKEVSVPQSSSVQEEKWWDK